MDKGKAIDRIQKLLKRTEENGATKSEAEAAAAEAARLLAKFNLSTAEVERAAGDMIESVIDFTNRDRVAVHVAAVVQEFYFVNAIFRGPLIVLFGEAHNVEVARYVFQFLHREFSQLCADEVGRLVANGSVRLMQDIERQVEPYCHGLALGLAYRLHQERDRFTPGERNALVVIDADIDRAMRERFPEIKQAKEFFDEIDPRDPKYRRGIDRGRRIEIREGIAGQANQRQAIAEGGRT